MIFISEQLKTVSHNPHYLNRYLKFIQTFSNSGSVQHHILPKSMFPSFGNLKQNNWNNSKLSPRAHYVAHWLLWKAFPQSTSMWKAFYGMSNKNKERINSKTYSQLRKIHSRWNTETKTNNPNMSKAMSRCRKDGTIPTWNKGVSGYTNNVSDAGRLAIIEATSRPTSNKTKSKMSKSMSSLPRVSCTNCKKEVAAHHLNRHLDGANCS